MALTCNNDGFSGTVTLAASNSAFPNVLQVGNGGTTGTLGTATVHGGSNVTLQFDLLGGPASNITVADSIGVTVVSGSTMKIGDGFVWSSSGTMTANGTLDLNGHNLTISGLAGSGFVENNGGSNSILTVNTGSSSYTYAGIIQNGSGAQTIGLTKTGTGTLRLTGANTYTGVTTINAGTLQVGDGYYLAYPSYTYIGGTTGTLGTGDVVINANGTLAFSRNTNSGALVVGNSISGSGALNQIGYGTVALTCNNDGYSGAVTLAASNSAFPNVLQVGNGGTTGTLGTATVHGGSNVTLQFDLLGGPASNITVADSIGVTVVSGSTMKIGDGFVWSSSGTMTANGTLDLNGHNLTISGLAGSGFVENNGGSNSILTVNTGSSSYTYAGIIQNGSGAKQSA